MAICKMCATGADMLTRADEIRKMDNESTVAHPSMVFDLTTVGKKLHKFCKGEGHCDCQHREQTTKSEVTSNGA